MSWIHRSAAVVAIGSALLACTAIFGCARSEDGVRGDAWHWHATARHPPAARLPSGSNPKLTTIALPEVKWSAREDLRGDRGRYAVGIYADGSLTFGHRLITLGAEDTEDGLTELRTWWGNRSGAATQLWGEMDRPHVEVYVDRSASWARVRSVLLFLALPPHDVAEVWFAVAHGEPGSRTGHLPGHVGVKPGPRGRVIIQASRPIEEDDYDEPEWLPLLNELREVQDPDAARRHGRYDARGTRDLWIAARREGDGVDSIEVFGTRIRSPGQLADPGIVEEANRIWDRSEEQTILWPRKYRRVAFRVFGEKDWRRPELPAPVVPAAYVLKAADSWLTHVPAVVIRLLGPATLEIPRPPEVDEPWVPSAPAPILAAIACCFGVVLAFACVFRFGCGGIRRSERPTSAAS